MDPVMYPVTSNLQHFEHCFVDLKTQESEQTFYIRIWSRILILFL